MGGLIAELVGFVLLLLALWRWVLPPVRKMLGKQQDEIAAQLEEGKKASEWLKQAEAEYREALSDARTTAASIRDEARVDAAAIRDEILAKAAEDRDRLLTAGREQLVTERQALVRALRAELGTMTVELSGRILTESLSDEARQRGMIERFIAELDSEAPAGAGGRQ